MNGQQALVEATRRLRAAEVADPARDARRLLAHAMQIPSDRLTLHLPDDLSVEALDRFETAISARENRQPVSQIIGLRHFFGRDFTVTKDVLDPRPETETLILHALETDFSSVLDLGLGSGCILLTLLAERPDAKGQGVDVSSKALAVAQQNAEKLNVSDRAELLLSDWFEQVDGRFDLIVSNPPYIDEAEWETLDPEPRLWEPKGALTPGADGLLPYRMIANGAKAHLKAGGHLIVEIGWKQGAQVVSIFTEAGFAGVEVLPDLDGRDRCIKGRWLG